MDNIILTIFFLSQVIASRDDIQPKYMLKFHAKYGLILIGKILTCLMKWKSVFEMHLTKKNPLTFMFVFVFVFFDKYKCTLKYN
jgi:hypothetical protein